MTIEIWVYFKDLERLKTIQTTYIPNEDLEDSIIEYGTCNTVKSQHCVHIKYDEFIRLTDKKLLIQR